MHESQALLLNDGPRQAGLPALLPVLLPPPPALPLLPHAESAAKHASAVAPSQCEELVMTLLLRGPPRTGSRENAYGGRTARRPERAACWCSESAGVMRVATWPPDLGALGSARQEAS